jgi:uncharacterized protein VirK/YbjX
MHSILPRTSAPPSPTWKDRAKLLLGAAVYPSQTRRWRAYVNTHPILRDLASLFPRVVHKIYRPYLSKHLNCRERVNILVWHYTIMLEAGLGHMIHRGSRTPVTIAQFEGKSGDSFQLTLAAINTAHREGELALQLVASGRTVYTASFVLLHEQGTRQIALGTLQGLRAADGAQVIKRATRELYGCRPKNLLIAALRQIGGCLGCSKLVLVSNDNRITVNWRRTARISSDYDATWRELDATLRADGNYELPCRQAPIELMAIPTQKRSEFRKRLALLAQVEEQVAAALAPAESKS